MRRTVRFIVPFLVALAAVPGCRRDAPTAETRGGPAAEERGADEPLYGATGADNLRVTPVEIDVVDLPRGWDGIRIATVSDFQLGLWSGSEAVARAAMALAAAQEPDFIALLGDYVARGADYEALDRVLEPVRGRPIFAVLGNEDALDQTTGDDTIRARTVEALERSGVRVLVNARAGFERNGDTAFVAGVEPYLARRPAWRQAEIYSAIPGSAARTAVVLGHMPVVAVTFPTDRYPAYLAGHTFCGDIEVPGTPRLRWVNSEIFPGTEPETRRIYRIRGATVFITCGIGHTYLPARTAAPPEVALVTLRRARAPDEEVEEAPNDQAVIDSLLEVFRPETRRDTTPAAGT